MKLTTISLTLAALCCTAGSVSAQKAKKPAWGNTWLSTGDETLPVDYAFQGEYKGETATDAQYGCQVIALDKGAFQAVVFPGGLPGDGWDGENRVLLDGELKDGTVLFASARGPKKYLAGGQIQFGATAEFPPKGHREGWSAKLRKGGPLMITMEGSGGEPTLPLEKVTRKSPTLGATPPEGAKILFDGSNTDAWNGGRLDERTGWFNTDARDVRSKGQFKHYKIHLEFMTPFRPDKRGQGRGNSGFYQADGSEVQVLDSFGLEGMPNECGGIYKHARPKVNMCFPPLTWQTYDVELKPTDGENRTGVLITVHHNGVLIHENVKGRGNSGGGLTLQGHGNPLQYRNIWLKEM